jgi:membrane-bound lytic murein transglycosylase D
MDIRRTQFGVLALLLIASGCAKNPGASVPAASHAPAITAATTPATAPVKPEKTEVAATTPPPATPAPDPVDALIASVEKEYAAGRDLYNAGQRDAAQASFDHAFDMLLGSPVNLRSDARLQHEFDQLMQSVNALELEERKEADTGTQKSEPAPIDEANDTTALPVDPNLKAKAEAEIKATHSDLPLMMTDPVASYIGYFSTPRGRGVLQNALIRSGRYDEMIRSILKQEGVPQDLIYLAQAESGFHPLALSRVGARGMWQFMASRASGYGLQRNTWVDERQDPEKSTRAAAHHLKDLYNQFGDWYLAMAAYNSGPGTVQAAVKRTGYADFWELYRRDVLPKETRNYVPIIVAVTIMAKNPDQYGLSELQKESPMRYETVAIDYPVDLRLVADCTGATLEQLQDLNPSLLRLATPDGHFDLHVPEGTKERYLSAIEQVPLNMRMWWRYHTVTADETLASIAEQYHTTPRAIAQANNLADGETAQQDNGLVIPIAPGKRAGMAQTYSKRLTVYKIRKGDTVQRVADNFGVPAIMIRRWNHLHGDSLAARHVLYVHLPLSPQVKEAAAPAKSHKLTPASHKTGPVVRHKVRPGETLTSIASSNHTTVSAIKRDNGNLATLRPGMVLLLHSVP